MEHITVQFRVARQVDDKTVGVVVNKCLQCGTERLLWEGMQDPCPGVWPEED